MNLNPFCMCCIINKQEKSIRQFADPEKKLIYMKEILRRFAQAGEEECAPSLVTDFQDYYSSFWGVPARDYTDIKKEYNTLMMSLEDGLRKTIASSRDPLETALIYARIGNYIDFAAMAKVDKEQMLALIEEENKEPLEQTEYLHFREEMSQARSLVYLTDNCGEIVLDKLAIEVLKREYPQADIHVIVRGMPVVNDATIEDARMCGLTQLVSVTENGNGVGGTWLPSVNARTRQLLDSADVILAKGQGNFETLNGCGLNIYYLFLCKCDWFVKLFDAGLFQGMFVNERRVKPKR